MASKTDWNSLTHKQRMKVLAETPVDQIVQSYSTSEADEGGFRKLLAREISLWRPENVGEFREAGSAPTKDVVLGAWRDLERSEALLELTDNSIDNWLRRRNQYPQKTSPELDIYIDIDRATHQLTFEDNAGGVSADKLENLVVPGHSETEPLSQTIGSYKTGGKKAIFRLSTAAQITTRYWNPAETSDEAFSVHLDQQWISDPLQYKFPYTLLKDKGVIERGQTKFVLQLREEPIGGPPWFNEPERIHKISTELLHAYSLLLIRNPKIKIHFEDRTKPLQPLDIYSFSGTFGTGVDIRPQQVLFTIQMDHQGQQYPIEIEIVLGCRTTSGAKGASQAGIDLYGNNRLFLLYDQTIFAPLLPAGSGRNLVRGFVNIRGPNIFIPWDTHKRHLNVDRDIINTLTKHPLIVEYFENWRRVYADISRSTVTKLIHNPLPNAFDKEKHDLHIPHRNVVQLELSKKRGVHLPKEVAVPKVMAPKKKNETIALRLLLSTSEARALASHYQIAGALHSISNELASRIKEDVLKKAKTKN